MNMAVVELTRRERFNAAHKLYNDKWSPEENLKIFGKCASPNWHGHNYELWVTVKGTPNPETGFLINLNDLKKIVREKVVYKADHKNLNLDVSFMEGIITTTENLAIAVWKELEADVEELGAKLHCVRIRETENNSVSYYGE